MMESWGYNYSDDVMGMSLFGTASLNYDVILFTQVSEEVLTTTRYTTTVGGGTRGGARTGIKKEPLLLESVLIGGLKTTTIKKVSCGEMFTACLTGII